MVEAYLKSVPPAKNCLEQQFVFWGVRLSFSSRVAHNEVVK